MSGGNGRTGFNQDELYDGKEKRLLVRMELSQTEQLIINGLRELKEDVKSIKACNKTCNLGELEGHVGHITDIVKEKGKKEGLTQGLNNFRDQDKQVEKILTTRAKIIERSLLILATAAVLYIVKRLGWS